MAISELQSDQQEEMRAFIRSSYESNYQQFQGVDYDNVLCNLVEPDHYGDFPDTGHVVLEVHGNMGDPGYFDNLNEGLEGSEKDFRPYAIDTRNHSPSIEGYVEELELAYDCLKSEQDIDSFSVVAHSLGCVGFLKWIHENDHYSEVDTDILSAGSFKGIASADMARMVDEPVNLMESAAKAMSLFNPVISTSDIEDIFQGYKMGTISDDFVSRKSAERGDLAQLMEDTTITEDTEVHTIRSNIDRWYNDLENTVTSRYEHLASLTPWENKLDSPEISGAEQNLIIPSTTHHEVITGDKAVEYIVECLNNTQK